jgi:transcription-repair coupling factor
MMQSRKRVRKTQKKKGQNQIAKVSNQIAKMSNQTAKVNNQINSLDIEKLFQDSSSSISIGGISLAWSPFFLKELRECNPEGLVVFVTGNDRFVNYVADVLSDISPSCVVTTIKEDNFDRNTSIARSISLTKLIKNKSGITITTIKSMYQNMPRPESFGEDLQIRTGEEVPIIKLQKALSDFGYERVELTELPGQFSVRGGLIDIFPILDDRPCRLDFLEDIVESIRIFDPMTQKSIRLRNDVTVTKVICDSKGNGSFFNYVGEKSVFVLDFGIKYNQEECRIKRCINIQPFQGDNFNFASPNGLCCNIRTDEGRNVFSMDVTKYVKATVSVSSNKAVSILEDILLNNNLLSFNINIIKSNLSEGFCRQGCVVYAEKQIFGSVLRFKSTKKIFKNYTNITSGDLVVHRKHGIAIFNGIETIELDSNKHDFFCLQYKNSDKLFVPVENIDLITRYGDYNIDVELDKLGNTSWTRRSESVRQKLLIIANSLLEIAAHRKSKKVTPIDVDGNQYEMFCKKFMHIETDDQFSAIEDVVDDLKGSTPMDRLICGDVGFGKTEIAMRAAFIVSAAKQQVIVLAPTTILANQHYQNFLQRFENTDITICQLSRFVSKTQTRINLDEIKNGNVKIIVATHQIFSSKITFDNLGLIIIDEEQHFGVRQKELIKSVQNNIHVLTMTATPIPRTLQMALSGIRDLSIIATPPIDRLPVTIYVAEESQETFQKAINNELDRSGQVFVVSPRVEFLDNLFKQIIKACPKRTIVIAHSKTPKLEKIINDFCEGKIDILVSTNIIDSGLNIQNANTIIIHRADMFGLSGLYQLKGRVGRRQGVRGYAYMLLPPNKELTENAEKRLLTLQSLTSLGSGFTLASHDLDIRGAGNIVGEEQSGYVKEVGIDLYQNMLEGAILMKNPDDEFFPKINLGVSVFIPEHYIEDAGLRTQIYRKIGDITKYSEVTAMEEELTDRFGAMPQEVHNLLAIIRIKLLCKEVQIDKIDIGNSGFLISFYKNTCRYPEKLMAFVSKYKELIKVCSDQKLLVYRKWNTTDERTNDIVKVIKYIVKELTTSTTLCSEDHHILVEAKLR